MIIERVRFIPVKLPLAKPLPLRKHRKNTHPEVVTTHDVTAWVCEITTDEQTGQGHTYSIPLPAGQRLVRDIENHCLPALRQSSFEEYLARFPNVIHWAKQQANHHLMYLLSALDLAVWDAALKHQSQSLAEHVGITVKQAPVYGSCGFAAYSLDELIADCQSFMDQGVRCYKLQVGTENDALRLKALREVFGEGLCLLADANQALSYEQALATASLLDEWGVQWFEEPVLGDKDSDLQRLAQQSQVSLASGENRLFFEEFEALAQQSFVRYWQPDIVRCGGVSAVKPILALCEAQGQSVAMHLNPEYAVSLSPSVSSYFIEYLPFFPRHYFTQDFSINDGAMSIPNVAGTGVKFSAALIREFRLNPRD